MAKQITISLNDDVFIFLTEEGGKNKSAYINALLSREMQRKLEEKILRDNVEEAADEEYQKELAEWEVAIGDGLT